MTLPRAVLWDWDNTLVDAWASVTVGMNAALAAFDMPAWSVEDVRRRARRSMRDTFPEMFGTEWERARDIFREAVGQVHLEMAILMPGADTALRAVADAGRYQAVVSNKNGPFLRDEARHLGIVSYFGALIGAGDAIADKPDPAPVQMALERSGILLGKDVWFVGDTKIDMDTARRAGCTSVLVGLAEHDGGPAHCVPDIHFQCLKDFTAAFS